MAASVEQHRFAGVDWDDLLARLTAEAVMLCGGTDTVLRGVGVSPEDLVQETVTKLLEDATVRYRKDRGPLLPFLKAVMRRDFYDLKRRAAHRTMVIADSQAQDRDANNVRGGTSLDDLAQPTKDQPDPLFRRRMMECASDDSELRDYVTAVLDLECNKPADVADLLSTTVADVENRRRRLRRRVIRHNQAFKGVTR